MATACLDPREPKNNDSHTLKKKKKSTSGMTGTLQRALTRKAWNVLKTSQE